MPDQRLNYVAGEWIDSDTNRTFETVNPTAPETVVATYPQSDSDDTERAIEAALDATNGWENTPGPERGQYLTNAGSLLAQRKDTVTELLVREEGKTWSEAAGEVQRAIDIFHYYGAKARDIGGTVKGSSARDTNLYTKRDPLGAVGLITPWNYPIAIPVWKAAPALAAGNTVVIKPASQAPGVVHEIADIFNEVGVPDGVFNVVTGSGSEAGDTIVRHPGIEAISFTGSTSIGETVYDAATEGGKRVQLEMGGKNPTIVSNSADIEEAADLVAAGAFGVTGQACTACSRAIVHTDVHDDFLDAIIERCEAIEPGDGLEDPDMGPHITESELESTMEYISIGQEEGAVLEAGGGRPDRDGYFVEPAVFSGVDSNMRIAQEEIFGPVISIIVVDNFEEAITVANDVEQGLSASIVTEDHSEANRFVEEVEAGVLKINEKTTGLELHVPFGGVKASSNETYREQGDAGIDFFTTSRTVYDSY